MRRMPGPHVVHCRKVHAQAKCRIERGKGSVDKVCVYTKGVVSLGATVAALA